MSKTINFYNKNEPYYEFTNFFPCQIKLKGKTWPTTEHYFQAQKFAGTPLEEEVRLLATPREVFNFARNHKAEVRADWFQVNDAVMHEAVWAKFTQHPDLAKLLIDTEDAVLVEHTENDHHWGDGGDGSGKNKLGRLLMQVREELRKQKTG